MFKLVFIRGGYRSFHHEPLMTAITKPGVGL